MNTECGHIADQLFSTLNGAWYGDSVQKILEGVTCEQALSHPIPSAHSIWELVPHVEAWCKSAYGAVQGISIPGWPNMPQEQDCPPVIDKDDRAWQQAVQSLLVTTNLTEEEFRNKFGGSLVWRIFLPPANHGRGGLGAISVRFEDIDAPSPAA
jgi:hypothetical protein